VASHEHNVLPFGTPQSYPLLSAQSKAVSVANNKERLGECHDILCCRTILVKNSLGRILGAATPPPPGALVYHIRVDELISAAHAWLFLGSPLKENKHKTYYQK
jgi:hypothetical protein